MQNTRTKLIAALLGLTACVSEPTQPEPTVREFVRYPDCVGPATSVDSAFDDILPLATYLRSQELFAALAKETPGGFGGAFFDKGQPVILLTDPSQAAAAKAAIAPYIAITAFDLAGADVREARWDFGQLWNWGRYLSRYARAGGYADVVLNRIVIGVENEAARNRLQGTLASFQLPCDLILIEIRPEVILEPLN